MFGEEWRASLRETSVGVHRMRGVCLGGAGDVHENCMRCVCRGVCHGMGHYNLDDTLLQGQGR